MNPILAMLKENNISNEQINELFQTLTQNPLAAMATLAQLGFPQDKMQMVLAQVMQNPALIKQAVEELGLDFAKVEAAKAKLQQ
ncbi:DUF2999 family protein [Vibrio cholerae]|uniref:DUF2999 family protein n=1 Tax=Vibrio cholerae TaxID=666 RepID=UPI0010FD7E64|nr:DUF2999 family protein [Vibrio cholerae]TLE18448.1 DUF2999 family protein [Vibrio cholerae]TLE33010.1 DUF2999 family protein [Vibrio cholerae]